MTSIWSGVSPLTINFTATQGAALTFTTATSRVDLIGSNILRIQSRLSFTSAGTPGQVLLIAPLVGGVTFHADNISIPVGVYNLNDASTTLKYVGAAMWSASNAFNCQGNLTVAGTAWGTDPALTIAIGDTINFDITLVIN